MPQQTLAPSLVISQGPLTGRNHSFKGWDGQSSPRSQTPQKYQILKGLLKTFQIEVFMNQTKKPKWLMFPICKESDLYLHTQGNYNNNIVIYIHIYFKGNMLIYSYFLHVYSSHGATWHGGQCSFLIHLCTAECCVLIMACTGVRNMELHSNRRSTPLRGPETPGRDSAPLYE